ncbi:hypothetical protein GIB67_019350 [Kingdonia uniflora]|uniref:Uncharacterized protein n=1 Tax=Kingdonia uniflora TaxID=39325 RepID=A0A7J7M1L6_9MAGN|nr:hypothetical protein GIB67_019350 [Kingdonia uniflora]
MTNISKLLQLIEWDAPDLEWVKLNFDAFLTTEGVCIGGALRNAQGRHLSSYGGPVGQCTITVAECWALWFGIKICAEHQYSKVYIEGDSQTVIAALGKGKPIPWRIKQMIIDIQERLSAASIRWQAKHKHREGNEAADYMTKYRRLFNRGANMERATASQILVFEMAVAGTGQLNLDKNPLEGSRSVDCFEKLEQIGEGTYGQVFMAKEITTGEIVALKKIRMDNEREGFPITAIREIKILKKLHHENVINLKEIVTSPGPERDEHGKLDDNKYKGSIYMVFEYMDHDLTGLSDRPGMQFTVPQIKCYMRQLLTGLHYCHVNHVLHRDIKGSNLLIDNEGNLKLADFGLARSFSGDQNCNLTNRVITLWYRPPELLLGATKYGPAVDMWSVGCILAELLYGKPILPGKNEPEQLNKIFELCGAPNEENWPGVSKIPWYNNFKPTRPLKRRVWEFFKHFDRHALELLDKMLTLDPSQRISAKDALDAEYFWDDPLPCDPKSLPKYESSHEFQTKKKRQQQRQHEEMAKRQKLQHPPQHARLPPIQHTGQGYAQHHHRPGFNQPMHHPPVVAGGPSGHHYSKPRGPSGGPNRYPHVGGNHSGGYNNSSHGGQGGSYSGSGSHPQQGQNPPYGSNGTTGPGPKGSGGQTYPQGGPYRSSDAGRSVSSNRNQPYGAWQ